MSARAYLPPEPPEFLRSPLMEQRDGGDVIDTRLHRASPIHQPPLSDEAHAWRLEQAEEDEHIERLHAIADRVVYVIFVLALLVVVFDRYWMLLPGVGQ